MPTRTIIYIRPISRIASSVAINGSLVLLLLYGFARALGENDSWYVLALLGMASLLSLFGLLRYLLQLMPDRRPAIWIEDGRIVVRDWRGRMSFDPGSMRVRLHGPNALLGALSIEDRWNRTLVSPIEFPRQIVSRLVEMTT